MGVALLAVLIIAAAYLGGGAIGSAGAAAFAQEPASAKTLQLARTEASSGASAPFRTCSIDEVSSQAAALDFHGKVVDAVSGEVLFERGAETATPTASTMKLVTAATALSVLGPDYRIPTRVYEGSVPGEVVIVGGGDVTLSSLDPGDAGHYAGATAFLGDLAAQTLDALAGTTVSTVRYDDSLFEGDAWLPSWSDADRSDGYIAPVTALMLDGDRSDPRAEYAPRGLDPAAAAAEAFAGRLGLGQETSVAAGAVPEGARLLAEVWSQPVSELLGYLLLDSDNNIAESLARLVAIESGTGGGFGAIHPAGIAVLTELGLDTAGIELHDGSGLSGLDRLTPEFVVELLQTIQADAGGLDRILPLLPSSALSGTLEERFDPTTSGVPAGSVQAKTGFIDDVYGLAGFLDAADGSRFVFAYYVVGAVQPANRVALDEIAAATYRCGGLLADW